MTRLPHLVLGALLALGASCVSAPPAPPVKSGPVAAPRAAMRARYQLGGPLRGERAPGAPLPAVASNPARSLALEVSVLALAAPPVWDVTLVTSQTRVVMSEGPSGGALRATPRSLLEARAGLVAMARAKAEDVALLDSSARACRLGTVRACIVPGATTVVEIVRDEPPGESGAPRRERSAVLLGCRAEAPGVDLAVEHEGEPGSAELVALTSPLFATGTPSGTWIALVPSPFGAEDEARWLAFVAEVSPPAVEPMVGAAAHEEVVGRAIRELTAQAETARLAVAPLAPPSAIPDIEATRRVLHDRASARRGLYSLASATGARTAEALAIAVDDHTLAPIASAVATMLGSAHSGKPAEMGIAVERATLAACRQALVTDPVPEDLPDALEWRGGAALRLLTSVGIELEKAKSLEDLEAELVTLNMRLLLDASPMVRARAARWLGERISLEGYTPLAPSVDRRAAVERIKKHQAEKRQAEGPRGSR